MTYKQFQEFVKEKGFIKEVEGVNDKYAVNLPDFYNSKHPIGSELIKGGFCEADAMMKCYQLGLYSIHNEPNLVNEKYLCLK